MINKLSLLTASVAIAMGVSSIASATSGDENCDSECRENILHNKILDEKSKEIDVLKKNLEIQRIQKEFEELSKSSSDAGDSSSDRDEFMAKLDELRTQLEQRIDEVSYASSPAIDVDLDSKFYQDTTGVDKVFVTATKSVGGDWTAEVYYDNSIQDLAVGDDVYAGLKITGIDRKGITLSDGSDDYVKRRVSTEVAHARAFSNLQREDEVARTKLQMLSSGASDSMGSSYAPPY